MKLGTRYKNVQSGRIFEVTFVAPQAPADEYVLESVAGPRERHDVTEADLKNWDLWRAV